ncbi:uncharacterized protein LOC133902380 [Phragmites australis]|uniref:uncharacterized protein LOC133902380 n=1 Tax=Phragmites australis TaxID=29695 RepID=UPI002D788102|nr:uncharacterized protein LOC133902380 [Phragmites australis]
MANASHALLSLCLLLAVLGSLAATTEAAPHRRLQQRPRFDDDDPKGPIVPPTVVACWKSILASENCVDDILHSLAALQVRVSEVCCSVLEKIGNKCVVDAFSSFPFNPVYPPLVNHICGLAV